MQGSLIVRTNTFDVPYWESKWRDISGKQIKRRIAGDAWLQRDDNGLGWVPRPGRPAAGCLSRDMAVVAATQAQERYEAENASRVAQEAMGAMATATFSDVAWLWLERASRRGRKRSTLLDYQQVLDTYLTSGNGNISSRLGIKRAPFVNAPVASLNDQAATILMRGWFDAMPPSRTRDKLLTITRGILRFANAEGYVTTNVASRVDRHRQSYDGSYDYYSVDEIKLLLAAATNELDRVLFATAAMAGLRRGELIALHWRDIDFDHHKIVVRGNIARGKLVSTKSGHHRVVPLVPELAEMLATIAPAHASPRALVFPGEAGNYMDPSALRRRYLKAAQQAGLRHLPFHSLRHHFASQAIQVASVQQVRSWCGHSDIRTTSRYLHSRSSVDDATLLARGFDS